MTDRRFQSWASPRMRRRLEAFARRFVKDAHEAEDIVQEVLLRAGQGQGGLRKDARAETWLFRICRHAAIDHVRSKKVRRAVWGTMPEDVEDWALPARESAAPRMQRVAEGGASGQPLACGLGTIPAHQRLLLELHYGRGYGQAMLSRLSGLSASALRVRLYRARRKLAQKPPSFRSMGPKWRRQERLPAEM